MAAPLGFKTFNTGDVLSAADTNGYLMQGIWVFADATARDAAVTSPQEGNSCYLKDTDVIQVYSGSSWVVKSGGSSPLTTKGDLYTYSTTDTRLPVGTNGHTLVADSSTATGLKWAAPAGGGKVLQVVSAVKTDTFSSSAASSVYADVTGLSASITPSAATSKILAIVSVNVGATTGTNRAAVRLVRDSTAIDIGDTASTRIVASAAASSTNTDDIESLSISFLDSPSSTSSLTYKVQIAMLSTGTVYVNRSSSDSDSTVTVRTASTITLLEIGA